MRIIVQRVFQAWVKVAGKEISHTKEGILVLIGVTKGDTIQLAQQMAIKALNMRLWQKEGKSWAASVMDIGGEVMVVSQFTLYGIMKGNKPDFHGALQAEKARQLYQHFVKHMKKKYGEEKIQTGQFQTLMQVGSVINGPVTIQYEKNAQQQKKQAGKIQVVEKKQKKQEPPKKDSKKSNKHNRNRQQSPQIKTNEDCKRQQTAQIKQQTQDDNRQGQ